MWYNNDEVAMTKEVDDFNILKFPKPGKALANYSEKSILNAWLDVRHRMEFFEYKEESNDVREGYLQFMDDKEKFLDLFREIVLDIVEAMKYYKEIREHAVAVMKIAKQQKRQNEKMTVELMDKGIDPLDPLASVRVIEEELDRRAEDLLKRKDKMDQLEEEIAITENMLQEKKSEMQLALETRYTLTEKQKVVLLEEKDAILDGIEEWGTIGGALAHNPSIKSKASTIQMYCHKFPEFGAAIEVSKQLFKDKLEAIMVERALEGTENPQFGKGEYIGDYKIKDNKMFLELMKAKMPEVYNKKADPKEKSTVNNTMNIISFANVDETKEGYARDIGVVLDVDNTGKVQRVQQEKKMLEYYKNKETAEIIEPEKER